MARSWEQLTPEAVASIELSETCQTTLPNAQLAIDVVASSDGAKQLNIEIAWRMAPKTMRRPYIWSPGNTRDRRPTNEAFQAGFHLY